jgi:WD40 repeat protein/tRNA A-37 threonylcarbamoyl transferase component Bud32
MPETLQTEGGLLPERARLAGLFQRLWVEGERPSLDAFLADLDSEQRRAALDELAHVDLRFRLADGEAARAEDYLHRYPELAGNPTAALDLIASEYRLRRGREPGVEPDEYLARFPLYAGELRLRLLEADPSLPGGTAVDLEGATRGGPGAAARPTVPGYEILGELGRGAMGIIYKARQVRLDRIVALKMIRTGIYAGAVERQRFHEEARAVARLRHPSIVQVHEVGEVENQPFFCLEYMEGGSLVRRLDGTPWAARVAAKLVETLARAMHHAHEQGIVHRDLKPGNILLGKDGEPKISDFGLAKRLDTDAGLTQTGMILGTPSYMAPEQAEGKVRMIGPATDVYALGAILYELVTGRPPFVGPGVHETLEQVRSLSPLPPRRLQPNLPRDLETITLKCLRKEPHKRYATAEALADDLERFRTGKPIEARPIGSLERAGKWMRRNPLVAAALALVVLVTAGAFVAVLLAYERAEGERVAAVQATTDKGKALETALAARQAEQEAKKLAEENRKNAERLAVSLILDRALGFCDRGQLSQGLLWLAHGVEVAERSEASEDLRRILRANVALWSREHRHLRLSLEHDAGHLSIVSGTTGRSKTVQVSPRPSSLGLRALAFSPDGKYVLTGRNRTAQLWDTETGQPVGHRLEHADTIYAVAFSPDGKTLLTGARDGTARLWHVPAGVPVGEPLNHAGPVVGVAFSPDGRTFLTGFGNWVCLFDAARQTPIRAALNGGQHFTAAAYSPDGKWALALFSDAGRLLDTATGKVVGQPLHSPASSLTPGDRWHLAAFSPDGKTAVAAFHEAQLWEVPSGKPRGEPLRPDAPIWGLAISRDGKLLVLPDMTGAVKVRDLTTGQPIEARFPNRRSVFAVDFNRDDRTLVLAGTEGLAWFWDRASGNCEDLPLEHAAPIYHAQFSPDGRRLLTYTISPGDETGVARLWDAPPGAPLTLLPLQPGQPTAFSPDGNSLLALDADGALQARELRTNRPLGPTLKHPTTVRALAYSGDGRTVLTAGADQKVRAWDLATGRLLAEVPYGGACRSMDCPPDRRWIVVDGNVWEAATARRVLGATGPPAPLAFHPDGRILVGHFSGNMAEVIDAPSGKRLGEPVHAYTKILTSAFSPDGRLLLTGGDDSIVRLWDVDRGRVVRSLQEHHGVRTIQVSADSRRILVGCGDGRHRLWNRETGATVGPLLHDEPVAIAPTDRINLLYPGRAAFSSNGKFVVSWEGRKVRLWDSVTGKRLGPALMYPGKVLFAAVSEDGSLLRAHCADGTVWLRDLGYLGLTGTPEQITLWAQTITGMELDMESDLPRGLDARTWSERRDRLRELGGPPRQAPE